MLASLIPEAQSKQKKLWFILSTFNANLDLPAELRTNLNQLINRRSLSTVAEIRELNSMKINRFGGLGFVPAEAILNLPNQFIEEPIPNILYNVPVLPH